MVYFGTDYLLKRAVDMSDEDAQMAFPIVISYIVIIVCISTVDNITNSVLLFLMLILRYGMINMNLQAERIA